MLLGSVSCGGLSSSRTLVNECLLGAQPGKESSHFLEVESVKGPQKGQMVLSKPFFTCRKL